MPSRYPLTLQSPSATAALPEVRALVFDHLAERHGPGVDAVAVERLLFKHGHNPLAAKILLREWSEAGALSRQTGPGPEVVYYRLQVRP